MLELSWRISVAALRRNRTQPNHPSGLEDNDIEREPGARGPLGLLMGEFLDGLRADKETRREEDGVSTLSPEEMSKGTVVMSGGGETSTFSTAVVERTASGRGAGAFASGGICRGGSVIGADEVSGMSGNGGGFDSGGGGGAATVGEL